MTSETVLEVVGRLVGYSTPSEDEIVDKVRYENQEILIDLIMNAVEDLIDNSKYKDSTAGSASKIGNRAYETLEALYEWIGNNI